MTVNALSLIQMIAMWASIILALVVIIVLIRKKSITQKTRRVSGLCIAVLIVLNIAFYTGTNTFFSVAKKHGMYDASNKISDVMEFIKKSPVEDTLPDELSDTLVLYYRFDCDDCHDLYDDLKEEISRFEEKTGDKIYWVSTRSEQGEILRETYNVSTVPSLMYIRDPNGTMPYYLEPIYYRESDKAVFYPVAWDKIMQIRDQYTTKTKFSK